MRRISALLACSLLVIIFTWKQPSAEVVRVRYNKNSPTLGIQEAVDSLSGKGGTVFVPAGRYILRCPVFLDASHSNLTITGEGEATILETDAYEYRLNLVADGKTGQKHILVDDTSFVKIGDGLYIYENGNDFGAGTVVRVTGIHGKLLALNSPLIDTYNVKNQAIARHIFNVFCAHGVVNLTIRNLKCLGNLRRTFTTSSWVGNSVFFLDGANITIREVTVQDSPADGIYIGGHNGVKVVDCRLENIAQRGIHLAGHRGQQRMGGTVSGNIISKVGDYGIYLCDNCRGLVLKGNRIFDTGFYEGPAGRITHTEEIPPADMARTGLLKNLLPACTRPAGIGGLGAGGDADNLIAENIIYRIKGSGIAFQRWVTENQPGRNMVIIGNNIFNVTGPGIFVYGGSGILVSGNTISRSGTGLTIKASSYCYIQGNFINQAGAGIQIYSFQSWVEKNIISHNSILDCPKAIVKAGQVRNNIVKDNYFLRSE